MAIFLVYFCGMEFYIKQKNNDNLFHRIMYDDVIMVESMDKGSRIHLKGKAPFNVSDDISEMQKRLKNRNTFIRSSSRHVVNMNCVNSIEYIDDKIRVNLSEGKTAFIRTSHPYITLMKADLQPIREADVEKISHSPEKDAIILGPESGMKKIIEQILLATGEAVTSKYVTRRYKFLKSK